MICKQIKKINEHMYFPLEDYLELFLHTFKRMGSCLCIDSAKIVFHPQYS